MGYSHFWKIYTEKLDSNTWKNFVGSCLQSYSLLPKNSFSSGSFYSEEPLKLTGCFHAEKPIFSDNFIIFNGGNSSERYKKQSIKKKGEIHYFWEDSTNQDLSHETFVLKKENKIDYENSRKRKFYSDSCKTNRKPYDLMVQICLLLLKYYFKDLVEISSDGDYMDWFQATLFIENNFGKTWNTIW